MFAASFKMNKLAAVTFLCSFTVLLAIIWTFFAFGVFQPETAQVENLGKYSLKVSDKEETTAFFRQFGLNVDFTNCVQSEIIIPEKFDSLYEEYNNLQKSQGLDLSKYKGQNAQQRIYPIITDNRQEYYAVLIVIRDKVVCGHLNTGGIDEPLLNFLGDKA